MHVSDLDPLFRCLSEHAARHRWIEPHCFIDTPGQDRCVLNLKMVNLFVWFDQSIKFFAESINEIFLRGDVIEQVNKRRSGSVRAGDDDQPTIAL